MSSPITTSRNSTVALEPEGSYEETPIFGVVKFIPRWALPQVEAAVKDFMVTSHLPAGIDVHGFYYQTLEAIANTTYLGGPGDFWLATYNGRVVVYGLAHISKDIDQKLCYHISQMWVAKEFRGKQIVKAWWEQIRQRAKDCLCGHLSLTSSRNPKAYERWLGDGLTHYADLLKMTL